MCGIIGAMSFSPGPFKVTPEYIERMRDAMDHRGPDGVGTWISDDGRVGLGHRRLSIIDLSTAALQPMSNADGSIWLVFNGEIYNHAEVRAELEATGKYKWKTHHSDTEVIIHAYEEWGYDCLARFRGMFAFALWDERKAEMWLVRDRIGVKPLYYSVHHGRIVFGSEIKALLEDPEQERSVDEDAFFHYLSFLTTPAPMTLFKGIRKLAGGTWLRVKLDGTVEEARYWDVWDHTKPLTGVPDEKISEMVLAELRESVRLRAVSDVPVGIFLSGGIDSSTNAALFAEDAKSVVKTFSIGYDQDYGTYKNELHHARRMAAEIKASHHERVLSVDDLIDFLPRMVHLQDEPIGDPVCVPVYYVSKLARDNGTIVCQVGEGSDELFWGYPWWKEALEHQERLDRTKAPRLLGRLAFRTLQAIRRDRGTYAEWARRHAEGQPIFWGGAEAFTDAGKKAVLSSRLRERFAGRTSWEALEPIHRRFMEKAWEKSRLNWMSYVDLNLRLPELLLMRVDKMSMGVSLEARVPFLDYKFVELAMSIPTSVKTRDGTLKHVLKKAVRGVIPDELIDRKKQGFGVPVYEWLDTRLGAQMRKDLEDFCAETDFLDRDEVVRLIDAKSGPQVWYLYNFVLWWRTYIQPGRPGSTAGSDGKAAA